MIRSRALVLLGLLVALPAFAAAQSDAKSVDPAAWAAPDSLAFIGIADVERLERDFRKTSAGRMFADERIKEVAEMRMFFKFEEQLRKRLGAALDIEPERIRNPFQGALALFITPPGTGEDAPGGAFVGGVGDPTLIRDYYDRAVRRLKQQSSEHEAVSFGSATIDRFVTQRPADKEGADAEHAPADGDDEDDMKAEPDVEGEDIDALLGTMLDKIFSSRALPERLALCLTDDRLIVSTDVEQVKSVLRREKSGENLAGTDEYKAIEHVLAPVGDIRFLVHIGRLFDSMIARPKATDEVRKGIRQAQEFIGGKGVRALIGHVQYADAQYESRLESLVLIDGERSGLAKLLNFKPQSTIPPARVGAETMLHMSVNIDPAEMLIEVEAMTRRTNPSAAEAMQREIEAVKLPDNTTINLRKELIENLRGPLTLSLGFHRPYDAQSPRMLMSLGHRDRAALTRLLTTLQAAAPMPLTDRDFGGLQVFDVPMGFSLAITDSAIFMGSTKAVEAAIKPGSESESLASEAAFAPLAKLAPGECGAMFYLDQHRIADVAVELSKQEDALMGGAMTNPGALVAEQMAKALSGNVGRDNAEAFRNLMQYYGSSIAVLRNVPEGIRLTQYTMGSAQH